MIHDSYWTMASGFLGVFVKAKGDQGEQGRWKKGQIFCLHIRVKLILVHLRSSNFSLLKYVHSKMFRKIISPFVIIYLKSKICMVCNSKVNICGKKQCYGWNQKSFNCIKRKSPVVAFHRITSPYTYFEEIWIFAPIQQEAKHDQEKLSTELKNLLTKPSNVFPFSNQAKIQIYCTLKLISWNVVNLSHL